MQKVWIYLENGTFLEAKSFGANGTSVGELVFSTSITGYQEVISDISNAGKFITFTMPEIGNVGVNDEDINSKTCQCKGILVRNYHNVPSNYRAKESLDSFLKEQNILGICDIDTRYLTKLIRDEGVMKMIASTQISSKDELAKKLKD
jgi:carbamoyl-phosphate synthase small subunit